jgi:large subunit ribosomal protein L54
MSQPDSDYPDWLWRLLDSKPTRQELLREAEGYFAVGGYDEVLDKMDEDRLRRLFRLDARERIREQNSFGGGF